MTERVCKFYLTDENEKTQIENCFPQTGERFIGKEEIKSNLNFINYSKKHSFSEVRNE